MEPSNEIYLDALLLLEGVQVPFSSLSVSYGVNTPPTCTLTLPASSILRDLPGNTKVHIFFRDLLPNEKNVYEWRLLFDGELSGYGVTTSKDGASIMLNGIHSTMFFDMMQLMTLDIHHWMYFNQSTIIGDAVIPAAVGKSTVRTTIMKNLMALKCFESMVDIVWSLVRSILEATSTSSTGAYYKEKLGNGKGGLKLLSRFFGVSSKAKSAEVAKPAFEDLGSSSSSYSGGGGGGNAPGEPTPAEVRSMLSNGPRSSFNQSRSDEIMARANAAADNNTKYGREGCARAVDNWYGGGYSENAGVMAAQVYNQGGLFTDSSQLMPGDLVFYENTYGSWEQGTITHVGVYAGNGQVIHHGAYANGTTRIPLSWPGRGRISGFGRPY
jgi:hypothetical protein